MPKTHPVQVGRFTAGACQSLKPSLDVVESWQITSVQNNREKLYLHPMQPTLSTKSLRE